MAYTVSNEGRAEDGENAGTWTMQTLRPDGSPPPGRITETVRLVTAKRRGAKRPVARSRREASIGLLGQLLHPALAIRARSSSLACRSNMLGFKYRESTAPAPATHPALSVARTHYEPTSDRRSHLSLNLLPDEQWQWFFPFDFGQSSVRSGPVETRVRVPASGCPVFLFSRWSETRSFAAV